MKKYSAFFLLVIVSSAHSFAQIDYNQTIQPIFNANCTSCHGSTSGVDLSSYFSTVNSEGDLYGIKIVNPGESSSSPLVDKIEPNPQIGDRMPQGGSLSGSDIQKIKDWINQGANEVATSNEEEIGQPESFKIVGNYPNPFNPSTNIQFEVPTASKYKISVFSLNGQLVKELSGSASIGINPIRVELNSQPSGMYVYRILATSNQGINLFSGVGKMILVK